MSARPQEASAEKRPALQVIDGGEPQARVDQAEVVAEILSDGTVRQVAGPNGQTSDRAYATGQVAGEGWTIWWDRRYWS